jgi:glutathione synthase
MRRLLTCHFPSRRLLEVDDFIANLWKVHLQVKEEGYVQPLSLGLFRSDYMLHTPISGEPPSLKQVEFNTISSSFGGLSSLVTALHAHLATFPTQANSLAYPQHPLFGTGSPDKTCLKSQGVPPPNISVQTLCGGLATAHTAYGTSKSSPSLPLCVIFLVQDNERNIFDQLELSTQLHVQHSVPSFRLPTSQILTSTSIPASNASRPLIYTPPSSPSTPYEVTVVYFRALYAPTEYNATSWTGRYHLERSAAIKCPTVLTHLAGSKKVQQALTVAETLEHFLPHHSASTLASLRSTFAPQYDVHPGSEGLKLATNLSTAANHVLKPQREGGGNNIYRTSIPTFLQSIPTSAYSGYILMELIKTPAEAKNTVLHSDGSVISGNVISELGIFGACLWRRKERPHGLENVRIGLAGAGHAGMGLGGQQEPDILYNEGGGYLLRTKGKDSDEGGVAAGFSSLDSLILYE